MSSAKSRSFSFVVNFHLNPVSLSFVVFLITKSSTNRKRKPDVEHPCFTPVFTLNHSDSSPSSMTAHCVSSYNSWTIRMSLSGIPQYFIIFHKLSLWTESNPFLKSTKFMYSPVCHSTDCSMMFRRMKSCSAVFLPSINPACSFLSSLSTPSLMRFISTFPKGLPGTDSKVTPIELSQTVKSPFFRIFIIISFWFFDYLWKILHDPPSNFPLSAPSNQYIYL